MKQRRSLIGSLLHSWSFWLAIVAMVVIGGISYATLNDRLVGQNPAQNVPVAIAKEGPLTISVTEAGTIQAREQLILKNEVEGQTTILFLIDEGTRVTKGDLLVELDASGLQDQLVEQQIRVKNAEAAFIGARENLAVVENQAKADIDKATLDFDFAKQDLRKYVEGEFPKLVDDAQSKINVSEEELKRAEGELKWTEKLAESKYIAQSEVEADRLAVNKSQLSLKLAKGDLKLLQDFTYKRELAQLESDVSQTEMALERTQRKAAADVSQAKAEHEAKDLEFAQEKNKLEKLTTQIAKAKIIAPMDGLVVYATSAQSGGFRGNQEPLDEGQSVRERQELIYLPTTAAFMADIKVHETSLDKIRPGLPVRITVDALPGREFEGKVAAIAPLPDAASVFMNPDLKVYNTQIHIDGNGQDLRNGMSCRAEIIVDYYPSATYVPVQAVMRVANKPTIYVADATGAFAPREIEIGLDNNSLVRVVSGLKGGERVLLAPPLNQGTAGSTGGAGEALNANAERMLKDSASTAEANKLAPLPASAPAAAAAEGGAPAIGAGGPAMGAGGPGGAGRPDFSTMTPEEREKRREEMRKRMEAMTPEEREAWQARMGAGRRGGQGGEGGGGARGEGGGPRGPRGGEGAPAGGEAQQ